MTKNQTNETKDAVKAVAAPRSRIAEWIEDPFASALVATAATATAVACVLGGMGIINLILS